MVKPTSVRGLCAALLSTCLSSAAAVIGTVAITPASTPAGVSATVVVTAVITDPGLISTSVNLQQLDAQGRVTGVVGDMRDDGAQGDATAGDKTFSLRFPIYNQSPGQLRYRVSAAFQGSLVRVFSTAILFNVTGSFSTGISISQPANLAFVNTSPVTVAGSTGDPNASVLVNSIQANKSGNAYQTPVPLQEGNNTITAVASNSNGSTSTASIQVTLDTTPPRVSIETPSPGLETADASITVTGIVNDIVVGTVNDQQATVRVNGVIARVANRTFIATIPLTIGANPIQAVAADRTGNQATASTSVTRIASTQPHIRLISGNNQAGVINTQLPLPLLVELRNAAGQPAPGTAVIFKVTENDGFLTPGANRPNLISVSTNSLGQAQALLTLGGRAGAGNNTVEAYAANFAGTAVFAATGNPKPAAKINVDSGNNQFGSVNQVLAMPFVAVVTDDGHNRLPGVPVTFTVKQGGGVFDGAGTRQVTTDSDGRALAVLTLGSQPGQDNNVVEASFGGSSGLPATFTASAKIPGNPAQTTISGVVLDNSNNPIPGVTIRLFRTNQGSNNNQPAQVGTPVATVAQGTFKMTGAPVGFFKLMADGATANQPGKTYPTLEYDINTVSGQDNTVGMPIYLPALDPAARVCVDATTGGVLRIADSPGFSLTILPGSATFPGGSKTGCVNVTPVNPDKVPMVPGFGQQPRYVVTIQPVGTTFNPPAAITIPNMDGLLPNAKTEMYSFDHDLAAFVAIGSGTVSPDGSIIASDPGIGVIKAGWHCGGDPNVSGSSASLNVTASASPAEDEVGKTVNIIATGTPPLDGEYIDWEVVDDPADPNDRVDVAEFTSTPNCANQPTCTARLRGKAPGIASVRVTFRCTTNGNTVRSSIIKVKFKIQAKIIELTYSGASRTNITADDGTAFSSPQWKDANENGVATDPGDNNFPVTYVRDTQVTLAGTIKFPQSITAKNVKVKGEGPNGLKWEITRDVAGTTLAFPATVSTGKLPNTVKLYADLDIKWTISFDNGAVYDDAGTTKTRTYVTLAAPIAPVLYESLLDISTRNADSQTMVANTVSAIWGDFQSPIPGVKRRDSVEMKYWNPRTFSLVCQTLAGILKPVSGAQNGNGSCLAWSEILEGTLQAQGISGATILQIRPDTTANPGATGFLVKDWKFDKNVTTGPNGLRNTDPTGDDVALFAKGNGLPRTTCVQAGVGGSLHTAAGGDDEIAGGRINTGANGICESTAAGAVPGPPVVPADVQVITVGRGLANSPVIGPGPNGKLDTAAAGDDTLQDGALAGTAYPYLVAFDAINQTGIPGQGNPEPPEIFENHFVVSYSTRIYDPSYGAGPFTNDAAHEAAACDGIAGGGDTVKKKGSGRELRYF